MTAIGNGLIIDHPDAGRNVARHDWRGGRPESRRRRIRPDSVVIVYHKLVTVHEFRVFMRMTVQLFPFPTIMRVVMMPTVCVQMFMQRLLMSVF